MSWKSIYEKACFMMADMDEGNAFPDKYELSHVVVNFDKDEVEALLMDIIHKYNDETKEFWRQTN
jgi:hypothetical protein